LGRHKEALSYAENHLKVSKEVGDRTGELTAEMNIVDLKAVLGIPGINSSRQSSSTPSLHPGQVQELFSPGGNKHASSALQGSSADSADISIVLPSTRPSTPSLHPGQVQELFSPGGNKHASSALQGSSADSADISIVLPSTRPRSCSTKSQQEGPGEDLFDLIHKVQKSRMNDQRCELPSNINNSRKAHPPKKSKQVRQKASNIIKPPKVNGSAKSKSTENLIQMLTKVQGNRMEEQRCSFPALPGLVPEARERLIEQNERSGNERIPDDTFLDMLMRCQASRINDQRADFPAIPRGPTVPDEDFFNLIIRLQSKRLNNQRASFDDENKRE